MKTISARAQRLAWTLTLHGIALGKIYHVKLRSGEELTVGSDKGQGGFAIFGYAPQPTREERFDKASACVERLFELVDP